MWRIGDDTGVKIWTDQWIPRPWSRRVITPRRHHLLERVSDLIDPTTGSRDEQLVRETLWPDDVKHILQIPLWEGVHDFIAWLYDSKGLHSVKSAYKLQVQLEELRRSGGQGRSTSIPGNFESTDDDSWKRLWKLYHARETSKCLPGISNMNLSPSVQMLHAKAFPSRILVAYSAEELPRTEHISS